MTSTFSDHRGISKLVRSTFTFVFSLIICTFVNVSSLRSQTNYDNYSGFTVDTVAVLPASEIHPSLFFKTQEISEILARKNAGGYALTVWNYIVADINSFKTRTPSSTTTSTRPQMAKTLAFGWIMLGDTAARTKAIQTLLIAYDNVPRTEVASSFADEYDEIYRATWLQNYCAAYDWIKGALTQQQDSTIRAKLTQETQILRTNMVTGVRYAPRPHNHRSKPAWAIGTAALTFSSDARAAGWLSFALAQANTVTKYMFSEDGIYREGGHYYVYNSVNLIPFLWHYKNISSVDLFPAHKPAFEWPVLVRTGKGWIPQFEDSYIKPAPTHMVARAYTTTSTRLHAVEPLSKLLQWNFFNTSLFTRDYTGATNDVTWEIDEYLTYDQSIQLVAPSHVPTVNLKSGQTIFRNGWDFNNPNHRYLVFHGAAEADNHDHPNQLSFILEGENSILATAPGYGADGFSDPLRDSWYIKPFANNIVTLSDNGPVDTAQNATPRNTHFLNSDFFDFAEKDTKYPTASGRIRRSIAFPGKSYWVITDFVSASASSPFKLYLHSRGSMVRNDSLITWTTSNDTYGSGAKLHAFIFTEGTPAWTQASGWTSLFKDQVAQQYVEVLRNSDSTSFMEVLIPKPTASVTPTVYKRTSGNVVGAEVVEGTTNDLFVANRRRNFATTQQVGTNALFMWRRLVNNVLLQYSLNEGNLLVFGADTIVATSSRVTFAFDRTAATQYHGVIDSVSGATQVTLQMLVRSDSVQTVFLNGSSIPFQALPNKRISFSIDRAGSLQIALGSVLPVQLVQFVGLPLATGGVQLNWMTLTEINNYGFFVQRKQQSSPTWTDATNGFLAGHGTTNIPHHYTFVDSVVSAGNWSYRLKQIDLDNSVHYTEPVNVNVVTSVQETVPAKFELLQNYPNPFNPSTEIKFSVDVRGRTTLTLHNLIGQQVMTLFDGTAEAGQYYRVRLDGSGLSSGVYCFRLQSGRQTDLKKLIVLK